MKCSRRSWLVFSLFCELYLFVDKVHDMQYKTFAEVSVKRSMILMDRLG